jgi:hypothetical protein
MIPNRLWNLSILIMMECCYDKRSEPCRDMSRREYLDHCERVARAKLEATGLL